MSRNQPDLFGDADRQGDLFGAAEPAPKVWTPDPDKVRRRLERILAEARAAQTMPWDFHKQNLFQTIFPGMANLLPKEEAADYCAQFQQEWDRLLAA